MAGRGREVGGFVFFPDFSRRNSCVDLVLYDKKKLALYRVMASSGRSILTKKRKGPPSLASDQLKLTNFRGFSF